MDGMEGRSSGEWVWLCVGGGVGARAMVGEHHIKTRIANQLFSCKSSVGTMFWEKKNVMQIMSFHKQTKVDLSACMSLAVCSVFGSVWRCSYG